MLCLNPVLSVALEETAYDKHLYHAYCNDDTALQQGPPCHPAKVALQSVSVAGFPGTEIALHRFNLVQFLANGIQLGLKAVRNH